MTAPSGANRILVLRQPVGVSVLVTPWNFPAAMATRKIGPALAAGCTVVLKPAKETPLTAFAVADILREAGVPDGVVNVVVGQSAGPMVSAMLADPRVRKLSFTGSTEVGRVLLRTAADTVTNCSMELGGNAPFLVFEDADIDAAIEGAFLAKMRNGGEACTAANRFYVQRSVADQFARRMADRMGNLKVGRGTEDGVQVGPLIDADGRNKVQWLVDDAVERGARVLTGGSALPGSGYFYPPTVITDVPLEARLQQEEIFGPVAPITTFATEEEALARANETEYGLASYAYTRDLARTIRLAEGLAFGMVGMDVETAVRARIPILTIISNNATMAIYPDSRFPMATARYQLKKLSGNFAEVAQALGAHGERIHKPHEIVPAIQRAIEVTRSGQPAVLEVMISEEGATSTFKFD